MRKPKPLLPLLGKPVICHCLDTLVQAGVEDIVLVVRAADVALVEAVSGYSLVFASNPRQDSEMADSIRLGLAAVDPAATGILVCLADHPLVRPSTVAALNEHHQAKPRMIIQPGFRGRKGHPVMFPANVLREVQNCSTLREVVRADPGRVEIHETTDPGVVLDMDTPADYARVCELAAQRPSFP